MSTFNNKKNSSKSSTTFFATSVAAACLLIAAPAVAVDKHAWEGGTVTGSYNGESTHKVTTDAKSRAEWRFSNKTSTTKTYTLTRYAKMGSWNSSANKISIMQVLNQKDKTDASKGSAPVNQLGIRRKSSDSSRFEYYIVQGGQTCNSTPEPKKGTEHKIKVSYKYGGTPAYYITGKVGSTTKTVKCQKAKEQRVGKYVDSSGKTHTRRPYYVKYGAYVTGSGKGGATMEWRK